MTLATTIYSLRLARGFSRQQLAALAGINREMLWAIETGQNLPQLRTLEKLATAFGVNPGLLFDSEKVLLQDPLVKACAPHVRSLRGAQRQTILETLRVIGGPISK